MTRDYGELRVRPARLEDAAALAPILRAADLQEIAASSGRPPLEVLEDGLRHSPAPYAAALSDGTVVALLGVAPTATPELGAVWLLGSDHLSTHRLTFLRHSREWLRILFADYQLLGNLVDARNTLHVAWLRWMGFRFLRRVAIGQNGEEFIEFVRLREDL